MNDKFAQSIPFVEVKESLNCPCVKQTESESWYWIPTDTKKIQNVAVGTAAIVGVATVGSFAAPLVLSSFGFTAAGPVAGSYAATWMSSIGVVKAGSLYSLIQSIAMGGTYATTVNTSIAAASGVTAAVGWNNWNNWRRWW